MTAQPTLKYRGRHNLAAVILLTLVTVMIAGLALTRINGWKINFPLKLLTGGNPIQSDTVATRLKVADGYKIEIFAQGLKGPRMLQISPAGHLVVSQPGSGDILIFHRQSNGALNQTPSVLVSGLTRPHGLDFYQQWLYVAEMHRVIRIPFDDVSGKVSGKSQILVKDLPSGGNHRTRTVRFGPDAKMYISIGSSCNVCIESNPYRASIWRFNPDGSNGHLFASGLRNSVGLTWSPKGHLYATDNGRDLLGDDIPACELNRIEASAFYGWPYFYSYQGQTVRDTTVSPPNFKQTDVRAATYEFRAHNAPLGLHFLQSPKHPDPFRGALAVALHGSWNKSYKDGYKVILLSNVESTNLTDKRGIKAHDFVWGFLDNDQVIGRPVDIAEDGDGILYVSDDYGGAIYRVSFLKSL